VCHFRLRGEDLTRIVRDMMLSDMVVEAWRVIAKGLAGDGVLDIAQAVLSGDQKLVGDETAGIDLNQAYEGEVYKVACSKMFDIQHEYANAKCAVLSSGPDVDGVVGDDIAVLPNLSPEHTETVLRSKAVIAEVGGQLAHLSIVAREQKIPMVLVKDATKRYLNGAKLRVSCSDRAVTEEST